MAMFGYYVVHLCVKGLAFLVHLKYDYINIPYVIRV